MLAAESQCLQVRMSSDELAPPSVRQERERIARRRIREVCMMSHAQDKPVGSGSCGQTTRSVIRSNPRSAGDNGWRCREAFCVSSAYISTDGPVKALSILYKLLYSLT